MAAGPPHELLRPPPELEVVLEEEKNPSQASSTATQKLRPSLTLARRRSFLPPRSTALELFCLDPPRLNRAPGRVNQKGEAGDGEARTAGDGGARACTHARPATVSSPTAPSIPSPLSSAGAGLERAIDSCSRRCSPAASHGSAVPCRAGQMLPGARHRLVLAPLLPRRHGSAAPCRAGQLLPLLPARRLALLRPRPATALATGRACELGHRVEKAGGHTGGKEEGRRSWGWLAGEAGREREVAVEMVGGGSCGDKVGEVGPIPQRWGKLDLSRK
ncbi:unnamed protein product [Urochloa humidicola]